MSLSKIYEGWKNHLFPEEKKEKFITNLSEERMLICDGCSENSVNKKNYETLRFDKHCANCGCTLAPKTKCPSCECPLNKWKAVNEPDYE
jgi:hypothetical protein